MVCGHIVRSLRSNSFDNRKVDVIEEGYDAVIRSGDIEDSRLTSRLLGRFRMLLVGAPDYFARHGKPMHSRELSSHACIPFRMPNTGKLQNWHCGVKPTNQISNCRPR
jgi:DNA-binding transcriptional LysR family regulator